MNNMVRARKAKKKLLEQDAALRKEMIVGTYTDKKSGATVTVYESAGSPRHNRARLTPGMKVLTRSFDDLGYAVQAVCIRAGRPTSNN